TSPRYNHKILSRRFRLFVLEVLQRACLRDFEPCPPRRVVDERMHVAWLALCQLLRAFDDAPAWVRIGRQPAVDVHRHLDVLLLSHETIDAREKLRASLDAVALSGSPEDERLMRCASVVHGELK